MKLKLIAALLLLQTITLAQTKTCTANCPALSVLLLDFDVKALTENTNPEIYKRLYYIAPTLRKKVQSAPSCLEYYDVNEKNPETIFAGGVTSANLFLPPAGALSFCEYLLTGNITGEGTVFLLTVNIETAITRKKIKTVNLPFSFSEGETYNSVAEKAAALLGSLQQTITDYETTERETNVKVVYGKPVVNSEEEKELLVVKPKKTKLVLGEETEVEINLKDCDGYPLKNRLVSFKAEMYDSALRKGTYGGTVTPSTVTTDAAGKAKVKFKAAPEYVFAAIVAHYSFEQPCGRKDVITGSAAIDLQQKPYKVIVQYSKRLKEDTDYSNATSEYTERREGTHNYLAQYQAEFYYVPRHPLEKLAIASNDDATDAKIYMAEEKGRSSDIGFLHYLRRSTKGELIADYQNVNNLQGRLTEDEKAAAFLDTTGIHNFGLILNLKVTGTFNNNLVEPDILNAATVSASSLNKPKEVNYYSHPMNDPDFPYQRLCRFLYEFNSLKNDNGVLTKAVEFLKIKVLIEK
ncbi:Ig-like domain-containing protein [Flavisolibacter ginsenosidimutans]|uniref:Big-1 domain-containing protein n=1 Tax=Flavisolibacter ginsenosidimutans TaxID=661481 RepID=A0A5B8UNC2_9BACT|nr:Ig-like domain-containing protein [Flavisolibacter ginsenosidimutans]QEC57946.1 hypothetical protein FSB75_19220 [Flavisolibacter ginsenosidimutans]